MSTKIKGITLEIGGDTVGLSKALSSVNRETNSLKNELRSVEKALKLDPKNTELLKQKQELLNKSVEETEKKVKALKKAKENADKDMQNGTEINQKEYRQLVREIVNAEAALKDLEKQAKEADNAMPGGKGKKNLSGIKDSLKGAAVAGGAFVAAGVGIVTTLSNMEEETREYREQMNRLTASYETNGHSVDTAKKSYKEFYNILGETDRAVEATQHLALLTKNEEELSKWADIAAGASAKFGNSLPIEGLTEATNETVKVGQVTGVLADALNWVGLSEDSVNEKLKLLNSEQERATYITDLLYGKYKESADIYKEMNADVIAMRESEQQWSEVKAELGNRVAGVKAELQSFGAEVLSNILNITAQKDETTDLIKTINEENKAYKEAKEAQEEKTAAAVAEIDYTTRLYEELQTLADENGNVHEKDKIRVEYILNELNSALGLELQLTGEQIQGYKDLGDSIEKMLEKKRAEIILASQEESYKKAVIEIKNKETEQDKLRTEIIEKQLEYDKAKAEMEEKTTLRTIANAAKIEIELANLQYTYKQNGEVINSYYSDIASYEENYSKLMSGKAEEIKAINSSVGESFKITGEETEGELGKLVYATGQKYAELQKKVDEGVKGFTQEMADEALTQYQNACTEYEKIGEAIPEGLQVGIENGKPKLKTDVNSFIDNIKSWFKVSFKINSPSKWSLEIGKFIDEGLANGIFENVNLVKKSFKELFGAVEEEHEELLEEEIKYNEEKERLEREEAQKELQRKKDDAKKELEQAKAKAKTKAEIKEAEKKYNEKLAEIEADNLLKIQKEADKAYLDNLKKTADNAKARRENIRSEFEQMVSDIQSSIDSVNSEMESFRNGLADTELVQTVTTKILNSDGDVEFSSSKNVLADLSGKRKELEAFRDNLISLKEMGIDEAMLDEIKELGGEEGANLAEALLNATDEQRETFIKDYKEIGKLSGEVTVEAFENEISEIGKDLNKTLGELNNDLLKQGQTWGELLGQGLLEKFKEAFNSAMSLTNEYIGGGITTSSIVYKTDITQNITATPQTAFEVATETQRTMDNLTSQAVLS